MSERAREWQIPAHEMLLGEDENVGLTDSQKLLVEKLIVCRIADIQPFVISLS
jgi:hypothetical protein